LLAKQNFNWKNDAVRYRIEISKKAREQLRALPKEQRRNIGWRMEEMREDLRGDVLKLQAKGNYYRLRVGNFRALFLLAGDAIQVYAVKDRKEAYE
jgi:mRNA-degrading endonuclease RelE of RelBE toxin-antitoxin system